MCRDSSKNKEKLESTKKKSFIVFQYIYLHPFLHFRVNIHTHIQTHSQLLRFLSVNDKYGKIPSFFRRTL